MTKQDFVKKYSAIDPSISVVMMVDLNLVINQILKEKEEMDFWNRDCE